LTVFVLHFYLEAGLFFLFDFIMGGLLSCLLSFGFADNGSSGSATAYPPLKFKNKNGLFLGQTARALGLGADH
jgi:hypothetical protein